MAKSRNSREGSIVAWAIISLGGLLLSVQLGPRYAKYLLPEALLAGIWATTLFVMAVRRRTDALKKTGAAEQVGMVPKFVAMPGREKRIYVLTFIFGFSLLAFFAVAGISETAALAILVVGVLAGFIGGILYIANLFHHDNRPQ